jgi:hypothetical protein
MQNKLLAFLFCSLCIKKFICQKKHARFAKDHFLGVKSGKKTGLTLFIVVNAAEEINRQQPKKPNASKSILSFTGFKNSITSRPCNSAKTGE